MVLRFQPNHSQSPVGDLALGRHVVDGSTMMSQFTVSWVFTNLFSERIGYRGANTRDAASY
jgi:hypothetical protein